MPPPMPMKGCEIDDRTARCRVLRQAWQPLVPCVPDGEWRSSQQRIGDIATALEELGDHLRSARAAGPSEDPAWAREVQSLRDALGEIDARLAQEAKLLVSALARCEPSRRREAWLGAPKPPEGADVLLDLLLEDEASIPSRLALVEDLVLLLATDEQRGTRRVVRDPASLTTRLRSACSRSAAIAGNDLAAAEAALLAAARRCELEALESALHAVEEQRELLGLGLLAPRILRAVIFFDTVVWNHLVGRRDVRSAPAVGDADTRAAAAEPDGPSDLAATSARAIESSTVRQLPPAAAAALDGAGAPAPAPETVRWRLDERPAASPPKRSRRRRGYRPIAAGGVIAVCTGFGLFAWMDSRTAVQSLPRSQLEVVSTVLDSGYRDQRGAGRLFVGTVAADWEVLRPEQRESSAWQIIDRLTEAGVREILLYGAERRVAMHYADGLPVRITP